MENNTFHIYRVFRHCAREVWGCPLPERVAVPLQENNFETLQYMFNEVPPYVFTKRATPFLAKEFCVWWNLHCDQEYNTLRNIILSVVEAYPASYHHAATQEIGIGFGLNKSHWLTWPNWRWNVVLEYGAIKYDGLSETELKSRKKNRHGRPKGVPDKLWGEL